MKSLNFSIIASISGLLIISNPHIAISQQSVNQPNRLIANNTPTPEKIKQLAQAVSVKISSNNKGGSGVLIDKQGTTYTVITNAHVISNKAPYRIQTPDKKIHTATVINKGNSFTGNDLAVLQFQAQENYQTLALTNTEIAENQTVFAVGFPDDSPEIVINSGKISLLSTQPLVGGYQIGYTNQIKQGMSGGPLLNESGQLIGINGLSNNAILTDTYTYQDGTKPSAEQIQKLRELSFAVPIQTLAKVAPNLAMIPPEWRNQQPASRPAVGNTFVDKVDSIAQQITVRIDNNKGNGSGVIIAKQGNTYYVVTARHVVKNTDNYEIITPDGKRYAVQQQDIFKPEGIDAALVKFTSNQTYSVATISEYNLSLKELFSKYNGSSFDKIKTSWVFISGFPAQDKGKRKLSPGFLSAEERLAINAENNLLSQAFVERGYRLGYSNLSLPGMSGGPVLDVNGEVIGINAGIENRKISHTEIGFGYGVPSSSILSLATQAGLKKESLKVVSTQPPSIQDSEIALLETHPLFALKKPSGNASEKDWFEYANQMWRIRRFSETISVLKDTIKRKPDFYQAYLVLGAALSSGNNESKDPEKALVALDKATMLKPDYYEAWKEKSILLSDLQKYPLALAAIDQAIKYYYFDDNGSLYSYRSLILFNLKRYPEALATIDKAIQIQPFYFNYFIRGAIRFQSQDYQGMLADMNQVIKLQPDLSWAYAFRVFSRIKLQDQDTQGGLADINQAIQLAPDNSLFYSLRGALYTVQKKWDLALADYAKAMAINPQSAEAHVGRGLLYTVQKKWDLALADFTKSIAINPQYAEAYAGRGLLYTVQKKWDLALADYTKAIAINPQYADAYNNRGYVYYDQKKWDLALADYTKAIAINPQYADAYNNRGYVYYEQKKWDLALADYTKAIAINPQYADAYYYRGNVYYHQEKWDLALADYTKAITINPQYADAYNNRGNVYYHQKKWDLALADYTKAIAINPQYTDAYKNRGDVYSEQKKWDLAVADYNQAIKLQPNNANAYLGLGVVYVQLKDYPAALANYNQGIKLQPNNAEAYFVRGVVYVQLKDYPAALADYNQGIKLQPDNAEAYFVRGDVYVELKDYPAALANYNQGIKLQPNNANAYFGRGGVYVQLKDYQAALANYNQGIKLQPNNANAYFGRAVVYQIQGNDKAALSEYNQALTKDEKLVAAIINIGYIKYERGDAEGAIQQWQKAVQINKELAEPQMALAVALYAKGEQQKALNMAQAALHLDKTWADVEVLKQNLWGKTLIAEAQKLLSHPSIQALRVKRL